MCPDNLNGFLFCMASSSIIAEKYLEPGGGAMEDLLQESSLTLANYYNWQMPEDLETQYWYWHSE